MPKQAKSVQMSRKVLKCVATARRRRELAGYLSMVYTVYKGVGLGIGVVAADLHDTAQVIDKEIAFLCVIAYLSPHFEDTAQRVETFGVSFAA